MVNKEIKIEVPTLFINFNPYAMARMSDSFFKCSKSYVSDMQMFNFFLLCVSIELGLKSAILSKDNSLKNHKRIKKINHNIEDAYAEFKKDFICEHFLNQDDELTIRKINPFYKDKGLEYITLNVINDMMLGLSSFPKLSDLQNVALKINNFLDRQDFFVNV